MELELPSLRIKGASVVIKMCILVYAFNFGFMKRVYFEIKFMERIEKLAASYCLPMTLKGIM